MLDEQKEQALWFMAIGAALADDKLREQFTREFLDSDALGTILVEAVAALHKQSGAEARAWLERYFGRAVADNERVVDAVFTELRERVFNRLRELEARKLLYASKGNAQGFDDQLRATAARLGYMLIEGEEEGVDTQALPAEERYGDD